MVNLTTPTLAIFIDADNVPVRHADEILKIIRRMNSAETRVSGVPRLYGNNSNGSLSAWAEKLRKHEFVPFTKIEVPSLKNSADIAIAVDAIGLLHSNCYNGFCIVSSDSDFSYLAMSIRARSIPVYGFGEQKASESYKKHFDRFVVLTPLEPLTKNTPKVSTSCKKKKPKPKNPTEAMPIISSAMKTVNPKNGWHSLVKVRKQIDQNNPTFSPSTYGSKTFSKLLKNLNSFELDPPNQPTRMRVRQT